MSCKSHVYYTQTDLGKSFGNKARRLAAGLGHFFSAVTGSNDGDPVAVDAVVLSHILVRGDHVDFGIPD